MIDQLRKLAATLSPKQQISILAAALVIGLGLWSLTRWHRERSFHPLYTNLSPEDAGAIVERLKAENIEFRVDDPAGSVKVPAGKVAELRVRLAAEGVPKSGRIGFEIFDQTNFGLTEFAEHVNYRRAMEGELERSVGALSEVERARIHISLPKDSVFLESRQEAKASVMVKLRRGQTLSAANASAIRHLVSSAVERLSPEAVTILDSNGNLLARPVKPLSPDGAEVPEANIEYRRSLERDLAQKVNATIEPLLGPDNFRSSVSVECDFTAGEQNEETFDPARSVMVASQRTEDVSGTARTAGSPGTASNLPRPAARAGGNTSSTTRRSENITYQTSRTVRRIRLPQGTLKRMSVAVLVNHKVRFQGTGPGAKRIIDPPAPETLKTLRTLVATSIGLSAERGDQLTVESLPFESLQLVEPPAGPPGPPAANPGLPSWLPPALRKLPVAVLAGIAAAVVLVLLAALFLLWRKAKKKESGTPTVPVEITGPGAHPSLPSAEEQFAAREAANQRLEAEAMAALRLPPPETKKSEILAKHLREMTKTQPDAMAHLLRSWLSEKER